MPIPRYLNLGCGPRFSVAECWTNLDYVSADRHVIAHNLNEGLPYADNTFDAVYHSHVLEHFQVDDGKRYIGECFRVLKPGGILRVAVPDLEQICRLYLECMERVETGDDTWRGKYEWIKLEMYDQTVRTISGGAMAKYLKRRNLDKEFIVGRAGNIALKIIEASDKTQDESPNVSRLRRTLSKFRGAPSGFLRMLRRSLLSRREREALELGLFRLSGEVHQWMYDVYSLRALLQETGFEDVHRTNAKESLIPNWPDYHLDVDADGFEHAPSSLYMEGVRKR